MSTVNVAYITVEEYFIGNLGGFLMKIPGSKTIYNSITSDNYPQYSFLRSLFPIVG
jgi:hypothetical protein